MPPGHSAGATTPGRRSSCAGVRPLGSMSAGRVSPEARRSRDRLGKLAASRSPTCARALARPARGARSALGLRVPGGGSMRMTAAVLFCALWGASGSAQTFRYASTGDLLTLDPHSADEALSNSFKNNIYEGL